MNQKVKYSVAIVSAVITSQFSMSVLADDTGLKQKEEQEEVMVITGQRIEKKLKDVAGTKNVVTSEDIDFQVVNDLNELFKYEPGIEVTGRVGGAQNIVIRGMGGDRVLMIKDGMRMSEGYGANGANDIVGRGFIETDTIKQVEVAKGAASSLYGSDALGGIIVFTTKDASDYIENGEEFGGQVKVGYTEDSSQTSYGASLGTVQGNFEHLIHLNARSGEEQQSYEESLSPFDIDSQSILYKGKYNINDSDFINFSYDDWEQETKGDSADGLLFYFRGLAPFGYAIVDENSTGKKTTDAFQLHYHAEDLGAFADQLNIHLYQNESVQEDIEYGRLDINAPMFGVVEVRDMWKTSEYKQETQGFLSNAIKQLNDVHTIGFGLDIETTESSRTVHEYREVEGSSTRDSVTNKFPKNDTSRMGLFINDEMRFADGKFIVTPGIRFDRYEMDPNGALKSDGSVFAKIEKDHTSANLGMLFHINDNISAFFQYGQGFKVPAYDLAYIEHYLQASSEYIYEIIPADDLEPEESDTYEIGFRGNFDNFGFSYALYENKFDNFLQVGLVNQETFFNNDGSFSHVHETYQYQNIDSVSIDGMEISVGYFSDNGISVYANASYQNGENDETKEYITSIAPLKGVLGVEYEADNWEVALNMNWASKMNKVNDGEFRTPSYEVFDLLFNYEFTNNFEVNLAVKNLFDEEYIDHLSVSGRPSDTETIPFTQPGRTASATVKYRF